MKQIAQADQVVGVHTQAKHRTNLLGALQLELALTDPLLKRGNTLSLSRRALIVLA
jgi:hypothetical protein